MRSWVLHTVELLMASYINLAVRMRSRSSGACALGTTLILVGENNMAVTPRFSFSSVSIFCTYPFTLLSSYPFDRQSFVL
jgi:hypothetical protein